MIYWRMSSPTCTTLNIATTCDLHKFANCVAHKRLLGGIFVCAVVAIVEYSLMGEQLNRGHCRSLNKFDLDQGVANRTRH
jgi:hypothetical protein